MDTILKKYSLLPDRQKKEVEDFIDFMLQKTKSLKPKKKTINKSNKANEKLFEGWAGTLKGLKDDKGNLYTGVSLQHHINEYLR
jgi:hypothetical protein